MPTPKRKAARKAKKLDGLTLEEIISCGFDSLSTGINSCVERNNLLERRIETLEAFVQDYEDSDVTPLAPSLLDTRPEECGDGWSPAKFETPSLWARAWRYLRIGQ